MTYVPYIVQAYDTFERIAQKAYGQPELFQSILDANPQVSIKAMPAPGQVLQIPVIDLPTSTTPSAGLPSWKR